MIAARQLSRLLEPIRRRLALLVTRAVVRLVDDGLKMQELQVTGHAGETLDGVERFQDYGFTSRPHPGAEALLLAIGGHRAHAAAVAVDDRRYRPRDLQPGESMMYTDEGDLIRMRRGRIIEVIAGAKLDVTAPEAVVKASTKVTLDTPDTAITGNVAISGTLDVAQAVTCQAEATVAGAFLSQTSVADPAGTMADMRVTYNGHTHDGQVPAPTATMG